MIHLKDITQDNGRIPLGVAPHQVKHVASSMKLLARAYAYRNMGSYACLIYDDELSIGVGLYYDYPLLNAYDFSQLFIDECYQGKGYGNISTYYTTNSLRVRR